MKYFLTTGDVGVQLSAIEKTGGTGNMLMSYALHKNIDKITAIIARFPEQDILIDSGAFSIWNTGHTIDRSVLLAYYQQLKKVRPDLSYINLDVIPGSRGQKPTTKEAYAACEQSWENYLYFKKNGIQTLPVFHEDDDFTFLQKMIDDTDHIAISPANDSHLNKRIVWLDQVFSIIKADYKTHGLAATADTLLQRYPFYSVDSVNWLSPSLYGRSNATTIPYEQSSQLASDPLTREYLLKEEAKALQLKQQHITNLWQQRGVFW